MELNFKRLTKSIVVLSLAIFLFVYGVVTVLVIDPAHNYTARNVLQFLLLTWTTGAALLCYVVCVVVDPGRVPPGWTPDPEDTPIVMQTKKDGRVRFCQKCSQYKPPRSHHCRRCGRCILRMDHHCPWMDTCIGHGNYKPFLQFLTYVLAALLHVSLLMVSHMIAASQRSHRHIMERQSIGGAALDTSQDQDPTIQDAKIANAGQSTSQEAAPSFHHNTNLHLLLVSTAFLISVVLTVLLGLLAWWHVYLVTTNRTTIEHYEGVNARKGALGVKNLGYGVKHLYDLGLWENMHQILGSHVVFWGIPVTFCPGDGTHFATNMGANKQRLEK